MLTYGGASKTGKTHLLTGCPNQDAWVVARAKTMYVAAVSDGLGSRENSQVGSKAAVRSVLTASRMIVPATGGADIIRLVHAIWRVRLSGLDVRACACTCLFAIRFGTGRLFAAALGDGVITIDSGGKRETLELNGKDFANSTDAMDTCKPQDWRYRDEQASGGLKLMLATDGVSDDIEEGGLFDFAEFVINEVAKRVEQRGRNGYVKKLLNRWTRPKSGDDKTLIVIKESA
ncbi:MAG: protein phosphatase 2C domain-containing protein [Chitinispirillales bacterium]|jgi:hypothetical protein|nr:protein phosphatase 2C domain-containing protein [Chitinispirillales bacterium]